MAGAARAHVLLPRPPLRNEGEAWEQLRRELRRYNLVMTVLGLTPEGRPHLKLVGTKEGLRRWLDQAGYDCVVVNS